MNFRNLFTSFEGRIGRKSFWLGNLAMIAIILVIVTPLALLKVANDIDLGRRGEAILSLILFLVVLYPWTVLYVKRLHDRARPGILVALYLVPRFWQRLRPCWASPAIRTTGMFSTDRPGDRYSRAC